MTYTISTVSPFDGVFTNSIAIKLRMKKYIVKSQSKTKMMIPAVGIPLNTRDAEERHRVNEEDNEGYIVVIGVFLFQIKLPMEAWEVSSIVAHKETKSRVHAQYNRKLQ